jgi:hypothetical protein
MFREMAEGKKELVAKLQHDIAEYEAQVAAMNGAIESDQDKLSRLEAGEDVPVRELDAVAILKANGVTDADIRHTRPCPARASNNIATRYSARSTGTASAREG